MQKNPRFIILGSQRSGTTVIRMALNSHSGLSVEDELLEYHGKYSKSIRNRIAKEKLGLKPRAIRPTSPHLVPLINAFFEEFNGFKIQTNTRSISKKNLLWIYLATDPQLKIIRIERENRLRQLLSLRMAQRSKIWHVNRDQQKPDFHPISLPPRNVKKWLAEIDRTELHFDYLFANSQVIKVSYEEIEDDINSTLQSIQQFLEIPIESLSIHSKKMNSRRLSECLSNYHKIAKSLQGTKWECFLD